MLSVPGFTQLKRGRQRTEGVGVRDIGQGDVIVQVWLSDLCTSVHHTGKESDDRSGCEPRSLSLHAPRYHTNHAGLLSPLPSVARPHLGTLLTMPHVVASD